MSREVHVQIFNCIAKKESRMIWLVLILFGLVVLLLFTFMVITLVEDITKKEFSAKANLICSILVLLILNGFIWVAIYLSGHLEDFGFNRKEMANEVLLGELGALVATIIGLAVIRPLWALWEKYWTRYQDYRWHRRQRKLIRRQRRDKKLDMTSSKIK